MAHHKRSEFGEVENAMASLAKALGHPARIAILKEIAGRQSCICGEIVEVLPLAQSTVSQHLKELLNAGLITGSIDGPRSCYCIDQEAFKKFKNMFSELMASLQSNDSSCCTPKIKEK